MSLKQLLISSAIAGCLYGAFAPTAHATNLNIFGDRDSYHFDVKVKLKDVGEMTSNTIIASQNTMHEVGALEGHKLSHQEYWTGASLIMTPDAECFANLYSLLIGPNGEETAQYEHIDDICIIKKSKDELHIVADLFAIQ